MRIEPVMTGVRALIMADPLAYEIVGAAIYEEGEREFQVPSITWTLLDEIPNAEVFHDIDIQFDPFTRSKGSLLTLQRRLHALLHRDVDWHLPSSGGFGSGFSAGFSGEEIIRVRSQFVGARGTKTAGGVYGGPMDFRITAVRSRYTS
jgi:hypothetical protein